MREPDRWLCGVNDMRTSKQLHEAAKLCFQDRGMTTLFVNHGDDKNGYELVSHKYGVHGKVGGLIFGTDMSSESTEAQSCVDKRLKHYGY